MLRSLSLLLLVVLQCAVLHRGSAQEDCPTPEGNPGQCIPLRTCEPLFSALRERRPTINGQPLRPYLRRSQCGYAGNHPLVCCPLSEQAGATTPDSFSGASQQIQSLLPQSCGRAITDYIVGGINTSLGEHPWLVGLEYTTRNGPVVACGGTLITRRHVLTAAHCLGQIRNVQLSSVRLGEHDLRTDPDCLMTATGRQCAPPIQKIEVGTTTPHPNYRDSSRDKHFDIGIITLRKDAFLTDYVQPICLPYTALLRRSSMAGWQQTVAGWGRTENSTRSEVKLRVTLPVLDNARCTELYRGRVRLDPSQLCAGGQTGRDSCSGDSGGPLMTVQEFQWFVTGVVSVGPQQCGTQNQPGVYTRVANFLPWILETLQKT